jgi:hypothetical protein
MNGVNPATFFILPFLGEKHPDTYPRFRDCFIDNRNDKDVIVVYTRVGGGNRDCGYGEEELYKHPNFISTKDDDFDSTYAEYVFGVPEEWQEDFGKIKNGDIKQISPAYKERLYNVFPKLKETFDKIFDDSQKQL